MVENDRDVALFSGCKPEIRRTRSKAIYVALAGDSVFSLLHKGVERLCLEGLWPAGDAALESAIKFWDAADTECEFRSVDSQLERRLFKLVKAGSQRPKNFR